MSQKKGDSLTEQIETARRTVDSWPEWMKSVAYVSSTALSESSARKSFEESILPTPVPPKGQSK